MVKEVDISKNNSNTDDKISFIEVNKLLRDLVLFDTWFEKILIEKVNFNDINGSFKYIEGENGYLNVVSSDFSLSSSLSFEPGLFRVHIDKLHEYKKDIKINGDVIFNYENLLEFTSSIELNVHDDVKLNIYTLANEKKLHYRVDSLKDITSIKHTVDILKLDKKVKYWVDDAIKMSSLSLKSVNGWFEYSKLSDAINNLHIKAIVNKLNYTYNQKIDSVYSDYTNIEFKNGILTIKPKNTYTYGVNLDDSWLKIDFTKKQEILTLHLLFDGMLNDDMLYILNTYKIKVPFKQTKGTMDTNLRLIVNLSTIEVDALGKFTTKEAQINYLGLDIDVFNANVFLNNFNVKVNKMLAKYKDIATASVNLDFNAKDNIGKMGFNFKDISLKEKEFTLNQDTLNVDYIISPKSDYINIDKSIWKYYNREIYVNSVKVPFNLKQLTATIPSSFVSIEDLASSKVSGKLVIKPLDIDLDLDIESFKFNNIKLDQKSAKLKLEIDEKVKLYSKNKTDFKVNDTKLELNNIGLNLIDNQLSLNNLSINMDDTLISKISGHYSLNENTGEIDIHNIDLFNKKVGEIFKNNLSSKISIKHNDEETTFHSNQFDIDYLLRDDNWQLKLNSFNKLNNNSTLLKKYYLHDGNISISKKYDEKDIKYSAKVIYPYKILVKGNEPVQNYKIDGHLNSNNIFLNINNTVHVNIDDYIDIKAHNVGINIDELLNLLDNDNKKQSNNLKLEIDAKNCFIFFTKDRHAVSDNMKLTYNNSILKAELSHKKGMAWFELDNGQFRLHGNNFGDEFMQNIFALSKFKNGSLEFSMYGSPKDYNGTIYVQNTTIHNYVILNNVLAFVNTIPSLMTFSLPGYNQHGLFVNSAYINFKAKDDIYKISDISMKSKEISIVGKGEASIKKNNIDLDLNLKTDLGSSISKIPLVGYILLGDDTVSASLKVEGKLDDPKVHTRLIRDIVVAPLNIIKRTILLPFNLLRGKDKK